MSLRDSDERPASLPEQNGPKPKKLRIPKRATSEGRATAFADDSNVESAAAAGVTSGGDGGDPPVSAAADGVSDTVDDAGDLPVSPEADGVTETGDQVDDASTPAEVDVTETGDQVDPALTPGEAGTTNANGSADTQGVPRPWPILFNPPTPSDAEPIVSSKAMPNGANLITLHMDNLDVRKALEVLSRQAGVNILVSPGVSGQVTVDLRDVTLEKALNAIVSLCNLTMRRQGDIIYVSSPDEVNQVDNTTNGLPVRVYRLNYARGSDLALMVKPLLTSKGRISTTPIVEIGIKSDSTRAGGNSLAGDEVLVVQDYEWVLKNADRIVAEVDAQPSQVLIEAVIVSVTLSKNTELGINFALLGNAAKVLAVKGSGAAINSAAGFAPATLVTSGGFLQGTPLTGSAAADSGVKFGFIDKDVTGFISALNTIGTTQVLATPRLLVLSKQRAEIQLGDRLGFRTLTQTQTSTIQKIEFMNVGTQLRLRPFISKDGMIRMEIHPERSSGEVVDNVPSTHTTEVTTNVMVPDGSTLVIGGLMEDVKEKRQQGIPGLMNIPWVGALFRLNHVALTRKELIVLLTPHIWKGEAVPPECVPQTESLLPSPDRDPDELIGNKYFRDDINELR